MDSVARRAVVSELTTARIVLTLRKADLAIHLAECEDLCESARAVCAQAQQLLRRRATNSPRSSRDR